MSRSDENLKTVPLHERHVELGGRMVEFAGYAMPVQYSGIKEEHRAVRQSAGIFDVSHMGRVEVRGEGAAAVVDRLVTNDVRKLSDGRAHYTAMCNDDGGIIDDLVVYRLGAERLLLCLNAANRSRDLEHIGDEVGDRVHIDDRSEATVQLAVQGPRAEAIVDELSDQDLSSLKFFRCRQCDVAGVSMLVARTGYTGEDGFELYLPAEAGRKVYDALLEAGGDEISPCGLGCRDTLRLEAGLLLHGQDIDESTTPLEAGLSWLVKFDTKGDFVGREALEHVREQGIERRLRGLKLRGRGVLRPGYDVEIDGHKVGEVTSGTYSPTLEASIGLGYIDTSFDEASEVDVRIRNRSVEAELVDPRFYERAR